MTRPRVLRPRRAVARLAAVVLLGVSACTSAGNDDVEAEGAPIGASAQDAMESEGAAGGSAVLIEAPSFDDVYAIFAATCGGGMSGCHVAGSSAGLTMPDPDAAYAALVDVASQKCADAKLVAPGDADASVLVQALEGTAACVKPMPLGRDALAAEDIATVRAWIDAGAARD